MKNIRNFSIIAHINHGKSTLADRIIEICNNFLIKKNKSQILDSMIIERERKITIKAQTVCLKYIYKKKNKFKFNLIDTPGHVDFNYEVNKSLYACEGAILLIDISKGIQSQTIFNYNIALKLNLKVIIVLNKIDIPNININIILNKVNKIFNIKNKEVIFCSSKTGKGIKKLLKRIILDIPSPKGDINKPLEALIIDSWFDKYKGVILLVRIFNGKISLKDKIYFLYTKFIYYVNDLGIFTPKIKKKKKLNSGEVGFIIAGIKNLNSVKIGDIITLYNNKCKNSLFFLKKIKPKIFASFFPVDSLKFNLLKKSLIKLKLNDSSFNFLQENSNILGLGFRCGFLGLFHMEIIKERLKKEFNIKLIITTPTILYKIFKKNGEILYINNPKDIPKFYNINKIEEPIAEVNIKTPIKYIGKLIKLCNNKRGKQINLIYNNKYVNILYYIPMSEIILNFFNLVKSLSKGYANLNYKFKKYIKSDIVITDVLLNKKKIDFFSFISHKNESKIKSKILISKLYNIIPKHMFTIEIQIMINNKIFITKKINSLKKNVLSKCYGGDINRKKKLLNKQKKGKKKMKKIGLINIPYKKLLFIYKL